MPSFSEIVGVIVTLLVLAIASGHERAVWGVLGEGRKVAITNARQDWGCPSLWDKSACQRYQRK